MGRSTSLSWVAVATTGLALALLGGCSVTMDSPGSDGRSDAGTAADPGARDASPRDAEPRGDAGVSGRPSACGALHAIIRDFRADHPDFEHGGELVEGIVEPELGEDGKPVYALEGSSPVTTSRERFDEWYRDVDGVNLRFEVDLPLQEEAPGVFVFDDQEFFPIDGMGWPEEEVSGHNYHFTTEIHATFEYRGGERFTFRGDDDVWVFVNGHLVIDLGGIHGPEEATVDFDAEASRLGITPGTDYPISVFHAERHVRRSSFRVETSIECFVLI